MESESATSSCRHFVFDDFHSARTHFDEALLIGHGGDDKESEPSTSSCRHFTFHEILSATENFNESLVIGRGGFGKVYKGNIMDGSSSIVAAIKRLDATTSRQGAPEFWAEVETLSKLRHCNLVSLIGYCNHEKEKILVYEFMSNGTLEDHLHKLDTALSWLQRLKICIGAGRGLHYLHTGTGIESGVIHRDVKSSNILLHGSWAAKISDFGLSKIAPTNQLINYVSTGVKGTFGYLDPDYSTTGMLTMKSDVYAFGVVLLEVLCRKPAVDCSLEEPRNLAIWALESIKEGKVKRILDPDMRGEIAPKCLKEFVRIVKRCLHSNPKQRSNMAEVLVSLESVLTSQEKFNSVLHPAGRTVPNRQYSGGALLGAAVGELLNVAIEQISKTARFKSDLKRLQQTLERIMPRLNETNNSIECLGRSETEIEVFVSYLENAKELVRKCPGIQVWNVYKKFAYANKLIHLEDDLLRFFHMDVPLSMLNASMRVEIEVTNLSERVYRFLSLIGPLLDAITRAGGFSDSCGVPGLPDLIIGFEQHFVKLKRMLLMEGTRVLVVSAPGGYGKTTLVKMLCHDKEIKGIFGDPLSTLNASMRVEIEFKNWVEIEVKNLSEKVDQLLSLIGPLSDATTRAGFIT